jgi:hypothetical protein
MKVQPIACRKRDVEVEPSPQKDRRAPLSRTYLPVLDQHFGYTQQGLPLNFRVLVLDKTHHNIASAQSSGNMLSIRIVADEFTNIEAGDCCYLLIAAMCQLDQGLIKIVC